MLAIAKIPPQPEFKLLGELHNLCNKIPPLQVIRDVPIYAKTVRELFLNKPGRKPNDPPTIHVLGKLSNLVLGRDTPLKYDDPKNPTIIVQIQEKTLPITLVDLGIAINITTKETRELLGSVNLRQTPTVLELADRSTIRLEEILEDIEISVDSWEYPTDFLVLQKKSRLKGHPLILGWPWLATIDVYIRCGIGNMTISHGDSTKNMVLYQPTKHSMTYENSL
jgi:hypothetical protein